MNEIQNHLTELHTAISDTATPCPLNDGGHDCTPFCPECEGAQFIDTPASESEEFANGVRYALMYLNDVFEGVADTDLAREYGME